MLVRVTYQWRTTDRHGFSLLDHSVVFVCQLKDEQKDYLYKRPTELGSGFEDQMRGLEV